MSKKPHSKRKESNQQQYDVSILVIFIGYLLIDFLPYFGTAEIIAPQYFYLNILNILVGLYLYINPEIFLGSWRSLIHKKYLTQAYIVFLILSSLSLISANNTSLGILGIAQLLVVFGMIVNFVLLFYGRLYLILKLTFIVGVAAFFQAGQALMHLTSFTDANLISEFLRSVHIKGNTGNVNIFSASLLTKLPFVLFGILMNRDWKRWFLMIALLLMLICILLINARASLLSLIITLIIFFTYYFSSRALKDRKTYRLALSFFVPLLIAFVFANFLLSQVELGARYSSTTERLQQINLEESSIKIRLLFWENALKLSSENPILGVGLGNWRVETILLEEWNPNLSLQAHNDFLEILAETGVFNGLIYLSLFVYIFVVNVRRVIREKEHDHQIVPLLTLMLLIIYGVDALFNFPLYRPTMQLSFGLLFVFTLINTPEIATKGSFFKQGRMIYFCLLIVMLLPIYVNYIFCRTSFLEMRVREADTETVTKNLSGKIAGDKIMDQNPKIPNVLRSTATPFAEYAGILYYQEEKYEPAVKAFDNANSINPYLGRSDFYKSLIAENKGMQDSAYFYMKSSFYRRTIKINIGVFSKALSLAVPYQDTTEMLKMYYHYNSIHNNPEAAYKTAQGLEQAKYNFENLEIFVSEEIEKFPEDTLAVANLNSVLIVHHIREGQRLYAANESAKALLSFRQALDIDTANALALQSMGFHYYNIGKLNEAIPYLRRSLEKQEQPNPGQTEYILGLSYLRLQDKSNGCHFLNLAKANFPGAEKTYNQICK